MTPAELIARLQLSSRCDCPEFSRDIAREMLGAAQSMERARTVMRELHAADLRAWRAELDQVGSIACAWAFDLGRPAGHPGCLERSKGQRGVPDGIVCDLHDDSGRYHQNRKTGSMWPIKPPIEEFELCPHDVQREFCQACAGIDPTGVW